MDERRFELDQCIIDLGEDSRGFKLWLSRYTFVTPFDDSDMAEDATLELEDGRKRDILLRRVVASSGSGEVRGLEPAPS